ncbi:MAG: hypothetical protein AAF349_00285 [Cyanobacteria bacterium P01_A01_bin.68]
MFCSDKNSATVIYSFNNSEEERFFVDEPDLPIEVVEEKIKKSSGLESTFDQSFDGSNPGSYVFTINCPPEIPQDVEIEIYLISAVWDDYGGIGTYSTGYGIVKTYEGEALLVGTGRYISGTVTNIEPIQCFARITLDWRYKNACRLKISKDSGKILYEKDGECPLDFEVTCDDDCPSGHIKCKSNKYPGYCCVNCSEFTSKIRSLGSNLR